MQRAPFIGHGSIEIEAGKCRKTINEEDSEKIRYCPSEIVSLKHSYPFRYLVPDNSTPGVCKWIFPMTFGGGLVGGDDITSSVNVGDKCVALVTSQESTKVYHCHHSKETVQKSSYTVGESALLCVLQDPIVCYEGANFDQKQTVYMTPTSNLVFLDWLLSGRVALKESWQFKRYFNCIEVQVSGETIIKDSAELEDTLNQTVAQAMLGFQVYGTCLVLGKHVGFLADSLISKYGRKRDIGEQGSQNLIVSVSKLKYQVKEDTITGCYLRFLAADMKAAAPVIHNISRPLIPVLGDDPYERKL